MNCAGYAAWIAKRLDGMLPEECLQELEEHLAVCRRCRAELVLQKKITESLAETPSSGLGPEFVRRVSDRALEISRAQSRRERLGILIPVFGFAAAVVLLVALRSDLTRVLPPLMEAMVRALDGPAASIGDTVTGFLAGVFSFQAIHFEFPQVIHRLLLANMTGVVIACAAVLWAFRRVYAFLRE
jgi:uncharacterized membrane protein